MRCFNWTMIQRVQKCSVMFQCLACRKIQQNLLQKLFKNSTCRSFTANFILHKGFGYRRPLHRYRPWRYFTVAAKETKAETRVPDDVISRLLEVLLAFAVSSDVVLQARPDWPWDLGHRRSRLWPWELHWQFLASLSNLNKLTLFVVID